MPSSYLTLPRRSEAQALLDIAIARLEARWLNEAGETCPTCMGSGRESVFTRLDRPDRDAECEQCGGRGEVWPDFDEWCYEMEGEQ